MKLVGIFFGEYQGHKYSKLLCTEQFKGDSPSKGCNMIDSKCVYEVAAEAAADWALYEGQEVTLLYDRFGKVTEIRLK